MEKDQTSPYDFTDYNGGIGLYRPKSIMEQALQEAADNYIRAFKESEAYQKYKKSLDEIEKEPELYAKVNEFRRRNFEIQNSANPDELFDKMSAFEEEFEAFRENKLVDKFLRAELGFCREMQEANLYIAEEIDFDVDGIGMA